MYSVKGITDVPGNDKRNWSIQLPNIDMRIMADLIQQAPPCDRISISRIDRPNINFHCRYDSWEGKLPTFLNRLPPETKQHALDNIVQLCMVAYKRGAYNNEEIMRLHSSVQLLQPEKPIPTRTLQTREPNTIQ